MKTFKNAVEETTSGLVTDFRFSPVILYVAVCVLCVLVLYLVLRTRELGVTVTTINNKLRVNKKIV